MEVDWEGAQEGHTCLLARDKVQATPGAAVVRYGVREEAGTVEQNMAGIWGSAHPSWFHLFLGETEKAEEKELGVLQELVGNSDSPTPHTQLDPSL